MLKYLRKSFKPKIQYLVKLSMKSEGKNKTFYKCKNKYLLLFMYHFLKKSLTNVFQKKFKARQNKTLCLENSEYNPEFSGQKPCFRPRENIKNIKRLAKEDTGFYLQVG